MYRWVYIQRFPHLPSLLRCQWAFRCTRLSLGITICGWLGSKHQLTNCTRQRRPNKRGCTLVEFMYLVFTRMPGESYSRRLRSLLSYLCYVALINSLVSLLQCWPWLVMTVSPASSFWWRPVERFHLSVRLSPPGRNYMVSRPRLCAWISQTPQHFRCSEDIWKGLESYSLRTPLESTVLWE